MIKHTDQMKISQIFNENFVYSIPKYQRGYSWSTKHWERMFDDLIENEKGYFFGTVICVLNDNTNPDKYLEYELIDGQQRFTTLSILLLSIYNYLSKYNQKIKNNENEYESFIMLKNEFIYKGVPRIQLQIQENNQDDYYYYLSENNIIPYRTIPEKIKMRRISKAYRYFYDRITKYLRNNEDENENKNEVEKLFYLIEKINSSVVVKIQVDSHADAYTLFEALNNAGMPLSGVDLIKNCLIAEASKDNGEEKAYSKWCEIIKNIGDDYAIQIRFFCYFYDAFVEEINIPYRNEKTKYYFGQKATRTNMLSIYEKLIRENYDLHLEKLYQASKMFAVLTNTTDYGEFSDLENELLKLERVQGASGYILLLNLFINKEKYELSNEILKNLIEYIIKFFVRRNVTNYPDTGAVTNIFIKITNDILDKKGIDIEDYIFDSFRKIFEDRDINEFKNALLGKVYQNNAGITRFLLCYYEIEHETKEKFIDLWDKGDKNKENYIWTIEHIFPEGENIPKDWVNMIGDGDIAKAQRVYDKYVHCFGNLTMTGYNSNLSNKSFDEKKNLKDSKGLNIGYNNGLYMNDEIYNKLEWKEEDIIERTVKLAKYFFKQYDIMGKSWDELGLYNNERKEIVESEEDIEKEYQNVKIINKDRINDAKQKYIYNQIEQLQNVEFYEPDENYHFKIYFYHIDIDGIKGTDHIDFVDRLGVISANIFSKYIEEMQSKYPNEKIEIRDFNFKVKDLKERGLLKSY